MKSKNQIQDLFSINLTEKVRVQGKSCLEQTEICTPSEII